MWKTLFGRAAARVAPPLPASRPVERAPSRPSRESDRPVTAAAEIARTIRSAMSAPSEPDRVVATIRQLVETQYQDEPAFVAELIAGFQRSVPVCLRTIDRQIASKDHEGLARTARSLKSTSRMIGLDRLSGLCKALEATSASAPRAEAARPLIDAIGAAYAEIRPLLDAERMRIVHEAALRA